MPITFTEDAVILISKIMDQQGLDREIFAINFTIFEGNLAFDFTREIENHVVHNGLKVFVDPRIQEDLVITTYSSSDGRNGIIFLGKEEYKGEICQ